MSNVDRATARKRLLRQADSDARSRAFASKIYREELGRHWQPRGLTKHDRLEVTRRYTRAWP
jgi:hypothetical protein